MSYEAQLKIITSLLKVPEPTLEYIFHKTRKWRLDWAWPEYRIAVEIEGGIYGRGKACPACGIRQTGAHSSVSGVIRDMEKANELALYGWIVLRVLPDELDLENGTAFNLLERAFNLRKSQESFKPQS